MRDRSGIDLLIANRDLQSCLGVKVAGANITGGEPDESYHGPRSWSARLGIKMIAITLREPVGQRQRLERGALGSIVKVHRTPLRRAAG